MIVFCIAVDYSLQRARDVPRLASITRRPRSFTIAHVSSSALPKQRHHLVDLGLADDQRRAERDDVARHVAQDRAVVLRAADQEGGDTRLRVEALLRRLVADELDGADEADSRAHRRSSG